MLRAHSLLSRADTATSELKNSRLQRKQAEKQLPILVVKEDSVNYRIDLEKIVAVIGLYQTNDKNNNKGKYFCAYEHAMDALREVESLQAAIPILTSLDNIVNPGYKAGELFNRTVKFNTSLKQLIKDTQEKIAANVKTNPLRKP